MSVEDEKKKTRKAPAKKATAASSSQAAGEKKIKAASAKSSSAKTKGSAKVIPQESVQQHPAGQEPGQVEHAQQTAAAVAGRREPTYSEISELAYAFFIGRGHQHGFHEHDWYRAERELRAKLS